MSNHLDFEKPMFELEEKINEIKSFAENNDVDLSHEVNVLEKKLQTLKENIYSELTPWQKVKIARLNSRPTSIDYINSICSEFVELHGDRLFSDDEAIIGGIGKINNNVYTIIGHQKGKNTKENLRRNFGMPHPEGYRKALRLMKQAEKFHRPVILFIDTPGAYCGIGAEERGQGEAIARNLLEMSSLKTPIICIVIGEGGSGGALALGVGDRLCMLEFSVYSVISPEGLSSILWKDSNNAEKAANIMKLTADDLLKLGIIDDIIKEPLGGAHNNLHEVSTLVKNYIVKEMEHLKSISIDNLLDDRYKKFRTMGNFLEVE